MEAALKFLKDCKTFYIATVTENGEPRVRPFGACCGYEGKLYIVTNNTKDVFKQMMKNPNVEISGMFEGKWIRLNGKAVLDPRQEVRQAMLDDCPSLTRMYKADDGLMEVLYLENCTCGIYSFTGAPEVHTF